MIFMEKQFEGFRRQKTFLASSKQPRETQAP